MFFPTVTETRVALEPSSADPFIADLEPARGGASRPASMSASTIAERIR